MCFKPVQALKTLTWGIETPAAVAAAASNPDATAAGQDD